MANIQSEQFSDSICLDSTGLQDYLKRLRTVDDSIILNLNTTVLTSSFQRDIDQNIKNCNQFHKQLKDAYTIRDNVIQTCLGLADAKLAQLAEAKQADESNLNVQKEFKRQKTVQRMIQKEISVEQIIQDRSLKALQERCRRYVNF